MNLEEIKKISIRDFLYEEVGIDPKKKGNRYYCSSPFSSDSDPSFVIYPGNSWYCWSTGQGGTIIQLVQELYGKSFMEAVSFLQKGEFPEASVIEMQPETRTYPPLILSNYEVNNEFLEAEIEAYAKSRRITRNYMPVMFPSKLDNGNLHPGIGFIHEDERGDPVGIKVRFINPDIAKQKYSSRGKMVHYVVDNADAWPETHEVWIVESEASANSWSEFLFDKRINDVVISFGGVNNMVKELPPKYRGLKVNIIVDYDGSEELYVKRIRRYNVNYPDATHICLKLPKTEDINTLYVEKKYLILNKIVNYDKRKSRTIRY